MADNNIIISDPSKASSKEVARIIAELIKSIKAIKLSLSQDIAGNAQAIKTLENSISTSIKDLHREINNSAKEVKDKAYKDLNNEVYKIERLIADMPQFSPVQLEEKFGAVIRDIESKFDNKFSTLNVPEVNPIAVRDMLESIQVEEEKLDGSAVKGFVPIHIGRNAPEDKTAIWIEPVN